MIQVSIIRRRFLDLSSSLFRMPLPLGDDSLAGQEAGDDFSSSPSRTPAELEGRGMIW